MSRTTRPKAALLIDTANCRNLDLGLLLKAARRYGDLVVMEAYANYANFHVVSAAAEFLYLQGVQLIHCPAWGNGSGELKSTADEMLMSRMQRLAQSQPSITRLILASGDGHFVPAMLEARRHGHKVTVFAEELAASRLLRKAADRFIPVPVAQHVPDKTEALGRNPQPPKPPQPPQPFRTNGHGNDRGNRRPPAGGPTAIPA